MARPALASTEDLDRLLDAPLTDAQKPQAEARLEQASEIVRAYAGTDWLNAAGTAVEDVPGAIPGVVAAMVERASRNPDGAVSETTGPFARSFGPEAATRLFLTKWEQAVIRHAAGTAPSGLQVISTTRGPIDTAPLTACTPYGTSTEENDPYSLWGES